MAEITVEVDPREQVGKGANRHLRSEGLVPAVVYGLGRDNFNVAVSAKQIQEILRLDSGQNTIFQLKLREADARRHVMIREYQMHPVTQHLIHLDFIRIDMAAEVEVSVPVELVGTPKGVKEQDGLLEFVTRELRVACLPNDIPEQIEVEVGALEIGHNVQVSDLTAEAKVRMLDEPDTVIATIVHKRVEEVEEEVETAEEEAAAAATEGAEPGAESAEGEQGEES